MEIQQMMQFSDSFTDEVCTEEWARAFANQAIARINLELNISLPLLADTEPEYSPDILPDDWQNALLVIFICWGVKMNDTSLNEADRYLQLFNDALSRLKANLTTVVPPEYQNPSGNGDVSEDGAGKGGMYPINTNNAINMSWFGPGTTSRGGN